MLIRSVRYVTAIMFCSFIGASYAQQTPAYDVVAEYVRQLGTMQGIQETSSKELEGSKYPMMDSIRGSARIKLELSRNIGAFKAMKVDPPFDGLLQNVVSWYQHKIELHDNLIEIASKFTSGTPQPGVDYAKLTAAMPQITANMEYIDKALYDLTPMFCLLLIDRKPDSKGLVSHLVITTEQRRQLVKRIDSFFGTRLSDKNRNYTIDSAAIIKEFLLGNRKSADDPWQ